MTDHPITPPRELVQQWSSEPEYGTPGRVTLHTISEQRLFQLLTRSSQWGCEQRGAVNEAELQKARDEELEACVEWVEREIGLGREWGAILRAARRPKPPSVKEQVLKMLDPIYEGVSIQLTSDEQKLIVKALESLPS